VAEENDMKSFGNFATIRLFFKMIVIFIGGSLADTISISFVYGVSSIFSVFFFIYVVFFFKEEKQKSIWVGCKKLGDNLKEFFKVLFKPRIIMPFCMLIMVSCCPSLFDLSKYVLINIGNINHLFVFSKKFNRWMDSF
jgi:hypothetical protein